MSKTETGKFDRHVWAYWAARGYNYENHPFEWITITELLARRAKLWKANRAALSASSGRGK